MEARAQLRYYRSSPRKVRLVADTVRGKPVERALSSLRLSPRYAAHDIAKVIRSAVANLEQKSPGLDSGKLVLKTIQVDQGPSLKRFKAASMGRVFPRLHKYCHVTVHVADREE